MPAGSTGSVHGHQSGRPLGFLVALLRLMQAGPPILFDFLPGVMVPADDRACGFSISSTSSRTPIGKADSEWRSMTPRLHGSSHYDRPPLGALVYANIGTIHVHHFMHASPITKYRRCCGGTTKKLGRARSVWVSAKACSCVKFPPLGRERAPPDIVQGRTRAARG